MSADNFCEIQYSKFHPGKYALVMGFASDDEPPLQTERTVVYDRWEDALAAGTEECTEYGVSLAIDPLKSHGANNDEKDTREQ